MAFVPAGQSLRGSPGNEPASMVQASSRSSSYVSTGLAAATVAVAGATALSRPIQRRVERKVVGVCLPLTDKFDPLNLGSTDAKMERYTAVEIKHGRVAMIAVVGYIMPEIFRFPGCEDFKHGLGALESIPVEGWVQLFALVGAHEVLVKPREGGLGSFDFGLGTELLDGIDDEELERKQTSERNNGRLAMVAILGLMWQDGTFGEPPLSYMNRYGFWGEPVQYIVSHIANCQSYSGSYVDNGGLCALPRGRTSMQAVQKLSEGVWVENETYPKEMEMSPSVPFLRYPQVLKGWVGGEKGFDPLGVTDALPVYWVREAELKHGRVCMLATVGWIATDLGARFPGEKFQSVANSVEAHDKMVEAGYMLPFLGAVGIFELFSLWLFFQSWPIGDGINREAGDYWLGKQFLPKEPEKEKDMRLKELENGRLAMFAFSGIVTQVHALARLKVSSLPSAEPILLAAIKRERRSLRNREEVLDWLRDSAKKRRLGFGELDFAQQRLADQARLMASTALFVASMGATLLAGILLPAEAAVIALPACHKVGPGRTVTCETEQILAACGLRWGEYPVEFDDVFYTIGRGFDFTARRDVLESLMDELLPGEEIKGRLFQNLRLLFVNSQYNGFQEF
ncbi:FCPE [Symbiodinium sp. KB8]|nr:FCPE [Symbiodinium sp. KB8]